MAIRYWKGAVHSGKPARRRFPWLTMQLTWEFAWEHLRAASLNPWNQTQHCKMAAGDLKRKASTPHVIMTLWPISATFLSIIWPWLKKLHLRHNGKLCAKMGVVMPSIATILNFDILIITHAVCMRLPSSLCSGLMNLNYVIASRGFAWHRNQEYRLGQVMTHNWMLTGHYNKRMIICSNTLSLMQVITKQWGWSG